MYWRYFSFMVLQTSLFFLPDVFPEFYCFLLTFQAVQWTPCILLPSCVDWLTFTQLSFLWGTSCAEINWHFKFMNGYNTSVNVNISVWSCNNCQARGSWSLLSALLFMDGNSEAYHFNNEFLVCSLQQMEQLCCHKTSGLLGHCAACDNEFYQLVMHNSICLPLVQFHNKGGARTREHPRPLLRCRELGKVGQASDLPSVGQGGAQRVAGDWVPTNWLVASVWQPMISQGQPALPCSHKWTLLKPQGQVHAFLRKVPHPSSGTAFIYCKAILVFSLAS